MSTMREGLTVLALVASVVAQAPDPWLTKAPPRVLQTVPYQDPAGRFTLEIPKKNWKARSAGLQAVAAFEHDDGQASIVIERQRLRRAMEPDAVNDLFVSLQEEELKGLDPLLSGLVQRIVADGPRRVLAAQYRRPAARGVEQVRIYTVPHAMFLYRLICRVVEAQAEKFDPIFAHAAASLAFKEAS
jgi:hypothetical protein